LLSDVLNFIVSICFKLKDEISISISFDNFMAKKSILIIELSCLAFNIKKEVCDALDYFLSLKKKMKKKAHNMLFLMLDPAFKNLHLISSFIVLEQGKAIVEKCDKKTLYPMLLKCHRHLHPLSRNAIVDKGVDEDYNLDIFKMTTNTNELLKGLVNKEFLIFKRF